MVMLVKLILAHLIGDFLLQPRKWIENKETKKAASPVLYIHVLLHSSLVLLFLWDLSVWPLALLIGATHLMLDLGKLYIQRKGNKIAWFAADQVSHLSIIAMLWWVWFDPELDSILKLFSSDFWFYLTAIFFLTIPAGISLRGLLSSWSKKLSDGSDESLADAGTYIGILERLLVFIFIMSGQWEGVGFLIAAKSIFRFGDLRQARDRKLTEYFLIGTLLSFGIAIVTALLTDYLIKL